MTKKQRIQQTYDHVLAVAAKLFRLKGYAATTVREIAQEAGLLPGSLHYRYATKEEILINLMRMGLTKAVDTIHTVTLTTNDPLERIRLALMAHMRLLLSGDDTFYVILNEWLTLTDTAQTVLREVQQSYEKLWDELFQAVIEAGKFKQAVNLELVRELSFGALQWFAQRAKLKGSAYTAEEMAEMVWQLLAEGVFKQQTLAK